ncbi:MAG: right-handed parallel beta-helix repeat-containing protein, partial [Verrucomicrobiota bacterium]
MKLLLFIIPFVLFSSAGIHAALFQPTSAADSGSGTLRQAIIDANATPLQPAGVPHTIDLRFISGTSANLQSALPVIIKPLIIFGNRFSPTAIDGGGNPIFFIDSNVTVEFSSVEFRNASTSSLSGAAVSGLGMATFAECVFRNCSSSAGGAVSIGNSFTACVFIDNSASAAGGALSRAVGEVTLTNCLFQNNSAPRGGALHFTSSAKATLIHCTIVENDASSGAGGGILIEGSAEVTLLHTIVAQNTAATGDTNLAHNTGSPAAVEAGPNFLGGDPELRPLANRGTIYERLSRLPQSSSPVVDAGTNSPGASLTLPTFESENVSLPRIFGPRPDLGASELRWRKVTLTSNSHGTGSLAEALTAANSDNLDEICLPSGLIPLSASLPNINRGLLIRGEDGAGIDGLNTHPGFTLAKLVSSVAEVRFENLLFSRIKDDPIDALGFDTVSVRHCEFSNCSGNPIIDAIAVKDLLIEQCSFIANSAARGLIHSRSGFIVRSCTFVDNTSLDPPALIWSRSPGSGATRDNRVEHITATGNQITQTGSDPPCLFRIDTHQTTLTHSVLFQNTSPAGSLPLSFLENGGTLTTGSNWTSGDPLLTSLSAVQGTPGRVRLPVPGSPVINAVPPLDVVSPDQAGRARPEQGLSDFGAMEYYADPYRAAVSKLVGSEPLCDIQIRQTEWGRRADLDRDGESNFVELVTDGEYDNGAIQPSTRIEIASGQATFRFSLRDAFSDLFGAISIQWSSNGAWVDVPIGQINFGSPVDGITPLFFPDPTSTAVAKRRIYRLVFSDTTRDMPIVLGVGPAGNAADPTTNRGAVADAFAIGRYEITNGEYVDFLNAVDPAGSNTFGLYNTQMATGFQGGILFDAQEGSGSKYRSKANFELVAVNFVSYWSAVRFCNWLHNGGIRGVSFQSGAYDLTGSGEVPDNASSVVRESDALYFLPKVDEWYKAAYFANDLAIGGLGAWVRYPVAGNSINTLPPPGNAASAHLSPGGL